MPASIGHKILSMASPLVVLWLDILSRTETASTPVADVLVPAPVVPRKIHQALLLLGSASAKLTIERCERFLTTINPRLSDLAPVALQHSGTNPAIPSCRLSPSCRPSLQATRGYWRQFRVTGWNWRRSRAKQRSNRCVASLPTKRGCCLPS